jgi:hypothetical protein
MIEAFRVGITIALMNRASSVLGVIARDFNKTDAHAARLQRTMKQIGILTIGGGILAAGGMAGFHMIGKWADAATEYEQAFARFQTLNLGSTVNRDADKFAQATQLMGVSATDLMVTVTDLHTVFGNYSHARAMAPMIARMEFANKAVFGDATKFDRIQALNMGKVIEMRGGFKSEEEMKRQADFMQHVMSGTGGRVMPTDYLAFLKTSGVAGCLQGNQNFYFQMEPLIQEMGGSRVGTALMSAYNNLGQGRTTVRTARELERLGMVLPGAAEYNKLGQLNRIKPGGVKGGDLVASDPLTFLRTVLLPTFAKKGISGEKAILNEIATIFTNRTAASLFSLIYLQAAKIDKNMGVNARAKGITALGQEADKTPAGIEAKANKSWENLKIQLGLKVLPIILPMIDKLADGLQYLAGAAEKHPGLAKWLVISAMGLSALAVVIGGIAVVAGGIMLIAAATGGAVAAGTVLVITGIAAGITILGGAIIAWWPQIKGFFGWIAEKAGQAWKWAVTDPAHKFHATMDKWANIGPDGTSKSGSAFAASAKSVPNGVSKRSVTVHLTNNTVVDGRVVAQVVTRHQGDIAARPGKGPSSFDTHMSPLYPNMAF